eukprot:gene17978-biopygen5602
MEAGEPSEVVLSRSPSCPSKVFPRSLKSRSSPHCKCAPRRFPNAFPAQSGVAVGCLGGSQTEVQSIARADEAQAVLGNTWLQCVGSSTIGQDVVIVHGTFSVLGAREEFHVGTLSPREETGKGPRSFNSDPVSVGKQVHMRWQIFVMQKGPQFWLRREDAIGFPDERIREFKALQKGAQHRLHWKGADGNPA